MFDTLPRGDSGKIERGRRGCARSGRARRVWALLESRRKPPRRSFSVAHARSGRDQHRLVAARSLTGRAKRRTTRRRTPRDVPRVPVPRDRPRSLRAFARAASRSPARRVARLNCRDARGSAVRSAEARAPQIGARLRVGNRQVLWRLSPKTCSRKISLLQCVRSLEKGLSFFLCRSCFRSLLFGVSLKKKKKKSLLQCVRSLEKGLSFFLCRSFSEVYPEMTLVGRQISRNVANRPRSGELPTLSGRFSFSRGLVCWTRPASFFFH